MVITAYPILDADSSDFDLPGGLLPRLALLGNDPCLVF